MLARRYGPLLGWLVGPAGALAVLTYAGRGALAGPPLLDPMGWRAWAEGRDPLDTAMALARTALLVGTWYVLAVTLASLLARVVARPRLVRAVDVLSLPAVRRAVHGAFGLGLATSSLTFAPTLAHAAPARSPVSVVDTHERPPTATMHLVQEVQPAATWTVRPGDHFWAIAESVLRTTWGRAPADDEIVPYWTELIRANRDRLAAPDNPDLVHAGQVFRLPPPPASS